MKKLMIIGPVVAIFAILGLGMAGIVKIPGLGPNKVAQAQYAEGDEATLEAAQTTEGAEAELKEAAKDPVKPVKPATDATGPDDVPPTVAKAPEPKAEEETDPVKGAAKVAAVWNNLKAQELAKIVAEIEDADLALVISKMEPDRAAQLLVEVDPKRAAKLSMLLHKLGSKIPPSA